MKLTTYMSALAAALSWTKTTASTFSPALPPAIPLAVKSPYLSTWLRAGNNGPDSGILPGTWPTFWSNHVTGWAGMIRVDGTTYTWMGQPGPASVNQTSMTYTSTSTVFTFDVAGVVEMKVTFLSPINPTDMKRQSLIFSYLDVEVHSTDGATHDVQVYSDVSGEWASGDPGATVEWQFGTAGSVSYHRFQRQTQLAFSEVNDQTEYGDWYYATTSTAQLSHQSGQDIVVRGNFQRNGFLQNTADSNFRAIDNDWPVFGFAVDLGSVGSSAESTLFTIGLTQQFCLQFDGANGLNPLTSLWTAFFSDELDALQFFHNDFSNARATATAFDAQVAQDATAAGGQDYLTITSLTARQAFGATQLAGTLDKMYLFMKEISSDGNVQTVDVMFPMHPILIYTNPSLLKLMLDPLFEYQESGQYPKLSAVHDLGSSYPNATGHNDGNDEPQPLEECGNMLIMTLAYAQKLNDVAYLNEHYTILTQWTTFLVNESLFPANQISTDDFAGPLPNQTNLALKGMIGIAAMAQIANLTGHLDDAKNYSSIAQSYIDQWEVLGVNSQAQPAHTTLNYSNEDTWSLLYNLYSDRELNVGLVPQWVYDMQSDFYPSVENTFGVPLDSRHTYTKFDWELFCAAIANDTTRDMFITDIAQWIENTPTNRPLTDLYDTISGDFGDGIQFTARPVVGAAFALLALNK